VETGPTDRYIWPWIVALAFEHGAKPALKLSEAKDKSTVAGSVHTMRTKSAALEWFQMFTCTQQLF